MEALQQQVADLVAEVRRQNETIVLLQQEATTARQEAANAQRYIQQCVQCCPHCQLSDKIRRPQTAGSVLQCASRSVETERLLDERGGGPLCLTILNVLLPVLLTPRCSNY